MNAQFQTRAVSDAMLPHRVMPAPSPRSRWMEVVSHLDPKYGGMSTVVPALATALCERQKLDVDVAAFCTPEETYVAAKDATDTSIWPTSRGPWLHRSDTSAEFREKVRRCDGVHIHGLWESCSLAGSRAAMQEGKPYIVSAHGMLEPWALGKKALKKRIYAKFIERPMLQGARCLHALTAAEAEDYRRFGCSGPICVVPNAVQRPAHVDATRFEEEFPQVAGKRMVLFLGRLHFKKGLDILIAAWSERARRFPDAELVLAGPSSEKDAARLQRLIREAGVENRVVLTGMLSAAMKWSALACAHSFVLPSYSEGLSVAALEALCMGVPAIVSKACHLPEVAAANAGWEIDATRDALGAALHVSLESSIRERNNIGFNAARLAERRFSWDVVSQQMAELYQWVLSGCVPEHVEILGGIS